MKQNGIREKYQILIWYYFYELWYTLLKIGTLYVISVLIAEIRCAFKYSSHSIYQQVIQFLSRKLSRRPSVNQNGIFQQTLLTPIWKDQTSLIYAVNEIWRNMVMGRNDMQQQKFWLDQICSPLASQISHHKFPSRRGRNVCTRWNCSVHCVYLLSLSSESKLEERRASRALQTTFDAHCKQAPSFHHLPSC